MAMVEPWRCTRVAASRQPAMCRSSEIAVWRAFEHPTGNDTATEPEHHHGQAATRAGLEVGHLRRRDHAVEIAEVFAHRGHDHAVAQLERADATRRQQVRVRLSLPPHVMNSPEFT